MKFSRFLVAAGVAASLALPLAASAQQAPPPPYGNPQQPYAAQQQPQGPGQPGQPGQPGSLMTPSADSLQRQYSHMFQSLNITSQQQGQIGALINAYAQDHPAGSPRDREATRDLRQQILAVLTPDQQAQFRQLRAQIQAQRRARRQQQLQQQQQQPQQQEQPGPPQGQGGQPGQPPAI